MRKKEKEESKEERKKEKKKGKVSRLWGEKTETNLWLPFNWLLIFWAIWPRGFFFLLFYLKQKYFYFLLLL